MLQLRWMTWRALSVRPCLRPSIVELRWAICASCTVTFASTSSLAACNPLPCSIAFVYGPIDHGADVEVTLLAHTPIS